MIISDISKKSIVITKKTNLILFMYRFMFRLLFIIFDESLNKNKLSLLNAVPITFAKLVRYHLPNSYNQFSSDGLKFSICE